jgi:UDP-N-acetylmuramate--alanine ligase
MKHIHVSGVAGVGMSALAEALLDQGFRVTGSDRSHDQGVDLEVLQKLQLQGLRLVAQDGSALTARTQALAVSTAIEEDNPEVIAARQRGVEIVHRADMLARLAVGKRVVAVTGTAGKTTITGVLGFLLEQVGFDPTVINGGIVLDWAGPARLGNVRRGASDLWVLEADESDRSLLRFHPEHAILANISKDHFELDEVERLFRAFVGQVSGTLVAGRGVAGHLGSNVHEVLVEPRLIAGRWSFTWRNRTFTVALPGRHNVENAALAVAMCEVLGADLARVAEALPRFRGVHRRLERVGDFQGAAVMDDYAHNPAKIAASWRAVAEAAPRIWGYWRPHGFAPLALMKDELAEAFVQVCRPDDRLFLLPVFYAGGTAQRSITSEDFAHLLQGRGVHVEAVPDYETLAARLADVRTGDAILGMGARDPELPRFARRLVGG